MPSQRVTFPEFDLMLNLVKGEHTGADAIRFFRELDASCSERWLIYFHPSVDMSRVDFAAIPKIRRLAAEKRKELFGETPKAQAIVCGSDGTAQFFFDFWRRLFPDQAGLRCFHGLEEAYDWLDLSEDARAAVASEIECWQADGSGLERSQPAPREVGTHVAP